MVNKSERKPDGTQLLLELRNLPIAATPKFRLVLIIRARPRRVEPCNSNTDSGYFFCASPDQVRMLRLEVEQTVTREKIAVVAQPIYPSTPLLFSVSHCG